MHRVPPDVEKADTLQATAIVGPFELLDLRGVPTRAEDQHPARDEIAVDQPEEGKAPYKSAPQGCRQSDENGFAPAGDRRPTIGHHQENNNEQHQANTAMK